MNTPATLPQLGLLTLRDPQAAAAVVLAWNLPKEALWTALGAVSLIVTILSTLTIIIFPFPEPLTALTAALTALAAAPFIYFILSAGLLVAVVYAVFWTGRLLGGEGRVEELMVLFVWLQTMRAVGQAFLLVFLIAAPFLADFFALFYVLASLWIVAHFVDAGLRLDSLLKAVVVLFLGGILLIVGLSIALSFLGVSTAGVPLNV